MAKRSWHGPLTLLADSVGERSTTDALIQQQFVLDQSECELAERAQFALALALFDP